MLLQALLIGVHVCNLSAVHVMSTLSPSAILHHSLEACSGEGSGAICLSTCHCAKLCCKRPCSFDAIPLRAGDQQSPAAADVTAQNACLAWLPRTQLHTKRSVVLVAQAARGCGWSKDTVDCMSDRVSKHHAACPEPSAAACCTNLLVRHALESQVS